MRLRYVLAFFCLTATVVCTAILLYGVFGVLHGNTHASLLMDGGGLGGTLFLWIGKKTLPK